MMAEGANGASVRPETRQVGPRTAPRKLGRLGDEDDMEVLRKGVLQPAYRPRATKLEHDNRGSHLASPATEGSSCFWDELRPDEATSVAGGASESAGSTVPCQNDGSSYGGRSSDSYQAARGSLRGGAKLPRQRRSRATSASSTADQPSAFSASAITSSVDTSSIVGKRSRATFRSLRSSVMRGRSRTPAKAMQDASVPEREEAASNDGFEVWGLHTLEVEADAMRAGIGFTGARVGELLDSAAKAAKDKLPAVITADNGTEFTSKASMPGASGAPRMKQCRSSTTREWPSQSLWTAISSSGRTCSARTRSRRSHRALARNESGNRRSARSSGSRGAAKRRSADTRNKRPLA